MDAWVLMPLCVERPAFLTVDVNQHVQALIRSHRVIDAAALADPDTPLDTLVANREPTSPT